MEIKGFHPWRRHRHRARLRTGNGAPDPAAACCYRSV